MKRSFNIFGSRITIKVADGLADESGRLLAGVYFHEKRVIVINTQMGDEEQLRTLMHELSHAVMYRVGLAQTVMTSDHHELVCEAFSNWIYEEFVGKSGKSKWPKIRKSLAVYKP